MNDYAKGTFGYDVNYLSKKDRGLTILSDEDEKSYIIVSAKYQAKVFTSTADHWSGTSLGFVNYKFFDSGKTDEHMNGFGGENRFWLGPEGGKYSIYFPKDSAQIYDNWHTPQPFDIEPWETGLLLDEDRLLDGDRDRDMDRYMDRYKVLLQKEMQVTNYLGTQFKLSVDRTIVLFGGPFAAASLDIQPNPNVKSVAYNTFNKITNLNDFEWTKETGTVCIWILDMFNPGPRAVTFIPFNQGDEAELGKIVTSNYFGEIPADRLKVTDRMIYLKTDGKYRSKIGLNPKRSQGIAGNYDPDSKRLTIIKFDVNKDATYLSQEWNPDKDPLLGDAMNAYNDGPLADGSIMGPFLELESVSPAAFLKPKQSLVHQHIVYHFIGKEKDLSAITEKVFGVSIKEINSAFTK